MKLKFPSADCSKYARAPRGIFGRFKIQQFWPRFKGGANIGSFTQFSPFLMMTIAPNSISLRTTSNKLECWPEVKSFQIPTLTQIFFAWKILLHHNHFLLKTLQKKAKQTFRPDWGAGRQVHMKTSIVVSNFRPKCNCCICKIAQLKNCFWERNKVFAVIKSISELQCLTTRFSTP